MNRITFDRIVSSKPETYPFVTVPQEEEEVIPERGRPLYMPLHGVSWQNAGGTLFWTNSGSINSTHASETKIHKLQLCGPLCPWYDMSKDM